MIQRILFLLPVLFLFFACSDDDEVGFDVPVEFRKISFDPIPGGAVMRYRLSDNMDIFRIRARYKDAYGRHLVKEGSYLTDTLLLNGFTEARADVPVQLTFLNNALEESAPLEMTFNTGTAATVALFENLSVNPFWGGGFNIIYSSPTTVEGTVHIFYVGINPATQREDNILLGSYPIAEGGDTLNFEIKQNVANLKVIVRTDDFEGNTVKVQTYEGIEYLTMEPLAPEYFTFSFPESLKIEDEAHQIGVKYLFDGQKKGANYRKNYQKRDFYKFGTFVAGPYAFNERFIIDFGTPKVPAMLRGDAFLYHGNYYPNPTNPNPNMDMFVANLWHGVYTSRLPAKIKVYGTNAADPTKVPLNECTMLYKLEEDPRWSNFYDNAWCRYSDFQSGPMDYMKDAYRNRTDQEFEEAEPISLDMKCNFFGEAFRYVFFVVEDTWTSNNQGWMYPNGCEENLMEYITFDELEVFVKKEY
ncbi:DUF4959 domain-containing protein [Butyricimonas hominis]|jgi:lipoprotein|uniref:DUF4959 domain-containing protein n=1 Tax=Butyricimonas hominis TaxID=2763032 RepID=UPI001C9A5531|nr:DUF4959 domain-containing protein [Butyricimonas hominis]